MNELHHYLEQYVDVKAFYAHELEGFVEGQNCLCPFHDDQSPSLSIDLDRKGMFYCHSASCHAKGTSFIGFYVKKHDVSYSVALQQIYEKYIRPIVPLHEVIEWHDALINSAIVQEWLLEKRGISHSTITRYKLGFDGSRVTIPIENEFGFLVNVRRYDISGKSDHKMLSYKKGYGKAALYPPPAMSMSTIVLVGGELDCLLGRQLGINCMCSTGGEGYWNEHFNDLLSGKDIIILYDNDDAGREGSQLVASYLKSKANSIKIAHYGIDGIDLTDYIIYHNGTADGLKGILREAEIVSEAPSVSQGKVFKRVKLQDAAQASMRGKPIEFKAHVAGKDIQPYIVPHKVKITCLTRPDKKCPACAGPEPYVHRMTVDLHDERVLGFLNCTEKQLMARLKEMAGNKSRCSVKVEVEESVNFEELRLIPPIEIDDDGSLEFKYVMRTAYIQGYNIDANATYIFRGYMYPDPDTQHTVFLLVDYEHAADQLDNFSLTPQRVIELQQEFPGGQDVQRIHNYLGRTYKYLSHAVTKIYKRRALHQAIDLAFHSALGFNFNHEFIRRGWLDVLVMGDTRTGKGYITERLCSYYGVGEVASGENCTFAGLVGGVQQIGSRKSWAVSWGFLPRNNRRLVVIDEAGAVAGDTLSRMSRVRSEGIAEVFKIVTERTLARTRIIWNANPTNGRSIREFEHGVEAVATLAERKEDIARFDYAVIVASDEVDPAIINRLQEEKVPDRPLFQKACRDLLLWIWSRTVDQVVFENSAVQVILSAAIRLGKKYHHSIPLIQIENVREKIAKVAVAVAGRVFSTDATGSTIVVTEACAEYAVGFFDYVYTTEACAYDVYSALQSERNTLTSEDDLERLFATYKDRGNNFIASLLENSKITVKLIEASLNLDHILAKDVRNKLVELRAIKQEHTYWVKREPFIKWLRGMRTKIIKDPKWYHKPLEVENGDLPGGTVV